MIDRLHSQSFDCEVVKNNGKFVQIPVNHSKMHRVTFLQNIKKTKSCTFGPFCSWLNPTKLTWFHSSSQDNLPPTHAGNGDIKTTTWTSTSHLSCLPTQELALGYKPPIAERLYLPGSSAGGFPDFLPGPKEDGTFPVAYKVKNPDHFGIKDWSRVCRELVDAELTMSGAILIR